MVSLAGLEIITAEGTLRGEVGEGYGEQGHSNEFILLKNSSIITRVNSRKYTVQFYLLRARGRRLGGTSASSEYRNDLASNMIVSGSFP